MKPLAPVVALATVALWMNPAHAQSRTTGPAQASWYLGASAGYSRIAKNFSENSVFVSGATQSTLRADEGDVFAKAYLGFSLSRYLMVETSALRLGTFGVARDVSAPVAGSVDHRWRVRGVSLDLVPTLPLGESLAVFARLGVGWMRTDFDVSVTGLTSTGATTGRTTDTKAAFHYGLGAQYRLSRGLVLRAEWEAFKAATSRAVSQWDSGRSLDYRALSAGASWSF